MQQLAGIIIVTKEKVIRFRALRLTLRLKTYWESIRQIKLKTINFRSASYFQIILQTSLLDIALLKRDQRIAKIKFIRKRLKF